MLHVPTNRCRPTDRIKCRELPRLRVVCRAFLRSLCAIPVVACSLPPQLSRSNALSRIEDEHFDILAQPRL
jgi:hypothetical protein